MARLAVGSGDKDVATSRREIRMTRSSAKLRECTERTFGSYRFIRLTRNPTVPAPARFEATVKQPGDVVI
jgi:hypothetical protein